MLLSALTSVRTMELHWLGVFVQISSIGKVGRQAGEISRLLCTIEVDMVISI